MRHEPQRDPNEDRTADEDALEQAQQPTPDVLPTDAPRGAQTIPGATQTGTTTPPISGWGETLEGEELEPRTGGDPRSR